MESQIGLNILNKRFRILISQNNMEQSISVNYNELEQICHPVSDIPDAIGSIHNYRGVQ